MATGLPLRGAPCNNERPTYLSGTRLTPSHTRPYLVTLCACALPVETHTIVVLVRGYRRCPLTTLVNQSDLLRCNYLDYRLRPDKQAPESPLQLGVRLHLKAVPTAELSAKFTP